MRDVPRTEKPPIRRLWSIFRDQRQRYQIVLNVHRKTPRKLAKAKALVGRRR
ncbi:uncharacterized protein B0I36DRAFT_313697 [Microdochium trichocladiopsis]|uniref:Uncharacterized protein n=1 Tax=Microdochium trichocladiopsis TaxID=1682393 RepID=A0A9P9BXQ9_9PEZI|nr:uncharacterized protein B0I36DRAFT_313697 [Microdochium trichocladiopsis]KAH7037288.1 hypothetical protein B0I36DRAFT_313697 [Microdochium trichocladiopsis]